MKKTLSIIILCALVFCTLSVSAQNVKLSKVQQENESTAKTEPENEILVLKTDIALLNDMGIMTDVEGGPFDTVTREETARVVSKILGLENCSEPCSFLDVDKSNPYLGNIGLLQKQGILLGDGDGNYRPKDEITYYEFIKVVVTLLGYEPMALSKDNGFPKGYLNVSEQIGLYIYPMGEDAPINKNDMAKIIVKALGIPVMMQTSYGANAEYQVMDGKDGRALITLTTQMAKETE